ncbi:hypothetical protein BUALT_Bualt15G0103800 [Buddleja alternifolia]|uniref:Chromo domain-containing protein n=1 Tax=Buddleja alternifolia TaxID=168488 RepID=A0AAV6WEQ2_9LAMI|nr:hypothetical protein BUALT_Bualt15G0103800 [Buddleja alternifolia]
MVETTRSNSELRKEVDTLRESIDELKSLMATVIQNQNQQNAANGGVHSGEIGGDSIRGGGYQIPTKVSRVEFPHFNGDDLRGWLYKCEQFFEVDETPPVAKVKVAAVGSIQQYLDRFDEIVNCLELPDAYALSCFLGGLRSEISVNVHMFRPKSLQEAISLAKLQEQALSLSQKKPSPLYSKQLSYPQKPFSKPNPPLILPRPTNQSQNLSKTHLGQQRRLSPQEIDEKRSKGLCFWCDEKFNRDHICKNKRQLYLLEVPLEEREEEGDDSEIDEDPDNGEEEITEFHISMHAMTGIHDYKTMRVTRITKGKPIHILIDTGSTHNFIDLEAAKRLGCKLQPMTPFVVSVADGNKIHSSFIWRNFSWKMQGVKFIADLMTIPLGGCDMVLGIQWLITLGDINWNFSQLKMDFTTDNKKVVSRGMQPSSVKLMSRNKINKMIKKSSQIAMLHVGVFQAKDVQKCQLFNMEGNNRNNKAQLEALLQDFDDLFQEPVTLPPKRVQDHRIILKEGTNPISLRPYRYPARKKDEIEKNVEEKDWYCPINANLPVALTEHGYLVMEPEAVIDRRIVQRHGRPASQWLVKWFNSPVEDSTWEFLHELRQRFPAFNP